jgi:hypothetical protein
MSTTHPGESAFTLKKKTPGAFGTDNKQPKSRKAAFR